MSNGPRQASLLMKRDVILSFCIATRNRSALIGATIRSILDQITDECEIVVVDGASTDGTQSVMNELCNADHHVRYFRRENNGGVDRDFDRAVEMASGKYCWLMPDDDILTPSAVDTVLATIRRDYGVVLVDVEHRDSTTWRLLSPSMIKFSEDRWFSQDDSSRLFEETCDLVTYIGCVVVNRSLWMVRQRSRYYGSEFIHVGTVFESPVRNGVYVIARPLVSIRTGNQQWIQRSFHVWWVKWPKLVVSLPLSESAKRLATREDKWCKAFLHLLNLRAICAYSTIEYRDHLRRREVRAVNRILAYVAAVTPGSVANAICIALALFHDSRVRNLQLAFLRRSPVCGRWWRVPSGDLNTLPAMKR